MGTSLSWPHASEQQIEMECIKDEIVFRVRHEARISKKKLVATTLRVFNLGNRPHVLEDAGYLVCDT